MFAPDVRIEGFDYGDWQRLWELLGVPLRESAEPATGRSSDEGPSWRVGLVVVHRRGRIVKLVHTVRGRLSIDDPAGQAKLSAAELARRHQTRWALRLEYGALARAMEAFGARVRPQDGMTAQTLDLLDVVHGALAQGQLEWACAETQSPRWLELALGAARQPMAPALLRRVAQLFSRLLDVVWPVGHALLLGAFEGSELRCGLVLQRDALGICRVLGPALLRPAMGAPEGLLEADHRRLCAVATELVGPLAMACSGERSTLRSLLASRSASELARARACGELRLDPMPGLAWLLALDSVLQRLRPTPASSPDGAD